MDGVSDPKTETGAEAHVFGTTKQLAEKVQIRDDIYERTGAGAEARHSFCDVYGPAKAVPLLQNPPLAEFFSKL
jgi:hypothetical protein